MVSGEVEDVLGHALWVNGSRSLFKLKCSHVLSSKLPVYTESSLGWSRYGVTKCRTIRLSVQKVRLEPRESLDTLGGLHCSYSVTLWRLGGGGGHRHPGRKINTGDLLVRSVYWCRRMLTVGAADPNARDLDLDEDNGGEMSMLTFLRVMEGRQSTSRHRVWSMLASGEKRRIRFILGDFLNVSFLRDFSGCIPR